MGAFTFFLINICSKNRLAHIFDDICGEIFNYDINGSDTIIFGLVCSMVVSCVGYCGKKWVKRDCPIHCDINMRRNNLGNREYKKSHKSDAACRGLIRYVEILRTLTVTPVLAPGVPEIFMPKQLQQHQIYARIISCMKSRSKDTWLFDNVQMSPSSTNGVQ